MNKKMKQLLVALLCLTTVGMSACIGGTTSANSSDTGKESTESVGGTSEEANSSSAGNGGSSTGSGDEEDIDYAKEYQSFWMKQADYKTMPVAAFNAFPTTHDYYKADMNTEQYMQWFVEAGFNVGYSYGENVNNRDFRETLLTTLENCEKYNISYMAGVGGADSFTDSNVLESAVYQVLMKDKPAALGGVMIRDEPSATMFNSIATSIDKFKEVFSLKRHKGMLWHVNLFPTYASTLQLSGDASVTDYSYEQHVKDYLETVSPQVLSYDYYPCGGEAPKLSKGYFENMSIIRRYAAEYEIPFWVYIQSCTWGGKDRVPNQADNDWQVNTALAYGAKGIQYFTYVTPGYMGDTVFDNACIDRDGNKTPTYDIVKETNKQVSAVDEVLMCSLSQGVIVAGETPVPVPEADTLTSYGVLNSVSGAHVLVGCFDYNGKDAYYVVNNSIAEGDTVTLNFNGEVSGYTVMNAEKATYESKSSLTLSLGTAKGVLVVTE